MMRQPSTLSTASNPPRRYFEATQLGRRPNGRQRDTAEFHFKWPGSSLCYAFPFVCEETARSFRAMIETLVTMPRTAASEQASRREEKKTIDVTSWSIVSTPRGSPESPVGMRVPAGWSRSRSRESRNCRATRHCYCAAVAAVSGAFDERAATCRSSHRRRNWATDGCYSGSIDDYRAAGTQTDNRKIREDKDRRSSPATHLCALSAADVQSSRKYRSSHCYRSATDCSSCWNSYYWQNWATGGRCSVPPSCPKCRHAAGTRHTPTSNLRKRTPRPLLNDYVFADLSSYSRIYRHWYCCRPADC